jgi:hypothetical protein
MPNRKYTDQDKQQARRLLLIHNGDVGVVHQLTHIPKRTLYDWRIAWDDQYDLFFEAFAQKIIAYADAKKQTQLIASPITADDSESAQPDDSFAQFTQLREILMQHVMTLANNLLIGDSYVNHRVIALSRLIDRIVQLDNILPNKNPEQVVRFEYYYDDAVHDVPPWEGASTYQPPEDNPPQFYSHHLHGQNNEEN